MIMLVSVMLSAMAVAEGKLDSVLGVPWGCSFEQARRIMAENNFSFSKEYIDPSSSSQVKSFKGGMYAGYPAYMHAYFIDDQMWQLSVTLWEDDIGLELDQVFSNLNKSLMEKYGPKSGDLPTYEKKPLWTGYIWRLHGNTKTIDLCMTRTNYENKWQGKIIVDYKNVELFNALKSKSRQNI